MQAVNFSGATGVCKGAAVDLMFPNPLWPKEVIRAGAQGLLSFVQPYQSDGSCSCLLLPHPAKLPQLTAYTVWQKYALSL